MYLVLLLHGCKQSYAYNYLRARSRGIWPLEEIFFPQKERSNNVPRVGSSDKYDFLELDFALSHPYSRHGHEESKPKKKRESQPRHGSLNKVIKEHLVRKERKEKIKKLKQYRYAMLHNLLE